MQNTMEQGGYGGELKEDEQHPWYVKYGIRALGTFAGGLALLLGAFGVIFSVFSPICMLFSIWQMLVGFAVVTIEAPFCCAFVDNVQVFARRIEERPLLVKAAVYVLAPLPSVFFCFGFYSFVGGGAVVGVGVVYGMIALGKKASREEMARNAESVMGSESYQQQQQQQAPSESAKNPFSTVNLSRDPIQAAASQWAAQSASKFEPPPSYNTRISNNQPRTNWDQSFVNEAVPSRTGGQSVKPPPADDPNNPFQ